MKKNQVLATALILATMASLSSCRPNLQSESGLYTVPLAHSYKVPVDGYWINDQKSDFAHAKTGKIYLAPLHVGTMEQKHPELAELLQHQMGNYMHKEFTEKLAIMNQQHQSAWSLTDNPAEASITFELSVVKFSPQHPIMKVLSSIGGFFISVPGLSNVAGKISAGDIIIEGVIKNAKTGQTLLAFKDSNRKTTRLYHKNAFTELGQADQNMQFWAERLSSILVAIKFDETGHNTLQHDLMQRDIGDVIKRRAATAI